MRILLHSLLALTLFGCASYPKKNGLRPVSDHAVISKDNPQVRDGSADGPMQSPIADRANAALNPYFSDPAEDYVYKANIEAFDNSFSGLLIVKKQGPEQHRIVFTTEMGSTLFDFSLTGDDLKVNHILEQMDRKMLINILHGDFKALIVAHPPRSKTFRAGEDIVFETEILSKKHYFYPVDGQLQKIVRAANAKEKVVFEFSGIEDGSAGNIEILHKTIPLAITLIKI